MSLWYESLGSSLFYEKNPTYRMQEVLRYLSMAVPRSWWESCLNDEKYISNYAHVLTEVCKELLNIKKWNDYSLFIALAFANLNDTKKHIYSLDEYYDKAQDILKKRPDLKELGSKISYFIKNKKFIKENIDILNTIQLFIQKVISGEVEIYNEFSLQHELGIILRDQSNGIKVQFERNVSYFGLKNTNFIKKEIDISIFKDRKLICCIELKFPRNGQYPEQMYSFCKDIQFMEQVKKAGFNKTFVIIFADDDCFYKPKNSNKEIYSYFRDQKPIFGKIIKPTGTKIEKLNISGRYTIHWKGIKDSLKYTIIEIQ